ncbi:hypothetical protein [Akkermansia glycaniphila]|uniref:Terminase-like family n=1 Tax=Akkermansia glycaniphila TaxID=1679444 RepID=A0A1C7P9U0_9BACT|nr:hypothetical protein [Akkermansia glycaniphila]OCA02311.1 hypothetical protein AC781_10795 [Akkermansia glycaniphila]OCA04203.1 hypothetical protein AC781_00475 [Akkermansia glycaniphila]SEH87532.1 terminase-like family [Akkermansia glycaniphila]
MKPAPSVKPLIQFKAYQQVAFALRMRIAFFLWRRQGGKSYTIAAKALDRMLSKAGRSCFFISASLNVGKELLEKEATIWHDALQKIHDAENTLNVRLGGNVVDRKTHQLLDVSDLAEIMQKNSAQIRIYHSRTRYSRTLILPPNPATARSWTGDVFGDEVGFWPHCLEVLDAVEPIIASNPEFMMWMFTTPSKEEKHYMYDVLNPGTRKFTPNPEGNFYKTETGYPVHRVDAYDAALAGVPLYDPQTGEAVDYDTYRAHSLDKQSADRNYLLSFLPSGESAVKRAWLDRAQEKGSGTCTAIDLAGQDVTANNIASLIGTAWADTLTADPCTMGQDVASTTNKKSNPSALTVLQKTDGICHARLIVRWKTGDYYTMQAAIRHVLHQLGRANISGLWVDSSNEKFYSNLLARDMRHHLNVRGIAGGDKVRYQGMDSDAKTALGTAYCAALEDGTIALPPGQWVAEDHRLVIRNGARFEAEISKEGYHADTFDSTKLAYWGHIRPSCDMLPEPIELARPDMLNPWDASLPNNAALLNRPF